jgi:hypothetical protein
LTAGPTGLLQGEAGNAKPPVFVAGSALVLSFQLPVGPTRTQY